MTRVGIDPGGWQDGGMDEEALRGRGGEKLEKLGGKKVGYIIGCKGAFMSLNLIMGPRRGHGEP